MKAALSLRVLAALAAALIAWPASAQFAGGIGAGGAGGVARSALAGLDGGCGGEEDAECQALQAARSGIESIGAPNAAGLPGARPGLRPEQVLPQRSAASRAAAQAGPIIEQPGARNQSTRAGQPARPGVNPADVSEFQTFVQQATGLMLPVYGSALFATGRFDPVQAAQVPAGYIVGPGDELVLQIYGAVDYADRVVVDRDGRILIPRVGPVKVAGLRFGELEASLSRSIGEVYRNFKLSVSMGRLRSIEVYLLGQARSPGRKVVGSLSTLINALFETGGPSVRGSLRGIELRRAGKVVTRLDLYDFIARGDSSADRPLEPGDIIFIPPVGPQVAVAGSVNEPAIYELPRAGGSIQSVLELSGGLPTLAAPQKAQLERLNPAQQPARFVQDIALDAAGLATGLQAGDIVTLFQISPQFSNAVTLQGNVAAPMRYAHREGMRVSDLVSNNNFLVPVSYWLRSNAGLNIAGLNQPEVNLNYATVQRLNPATVRTEVLAFNLAKALLGDPKENLQLKPGDLVRVYGAEEPGIDAVESVSLQAGFVEGVQRFSWRDGHRVTDVIPNLEWLRERVVRWVRMAGGPVTSTQPQPAVGQTAAATGQSAALAARAAQLGSTGLATAATTAPSSAATARTQADLRSVTARLSAAEFQELNLDYADIKRIDPVTMQVQLIPFNLGRALAGDESQNLALRPGDRISLYTKSEVPVPIARRTRLVKVSGEVKTPGTYQVMPGETLADLVRRAGGFTSEAYVYGSTFTRESTRLEQRRNLDQLVRTLESDLIAQANFVAQNTTQADAQQSQALLAFQRQTLERLRTLEPTGRIALDLDEKARQPALPALELEDGDSISIPTHTDFIGVFGAVDIANAMIYRPGQRVRDYLDRAGVRPFADLDNLVLLKADGTVRTARTAQQRSSFFSWGDTALLDQEVRPGDSVLVPEQIDRRTGYTRFIIGAKDWTQLLYQFGLGAAAFKVLRQ